MAFNPFTDFQRNRRFWMAAILMMSMVTFVFCTGVRGDLSDYLLRILRPRGTTMARVNGDNISRDELQELRTHRNAVNEVMRKCADITLRNVTEELKKETGKPVNEKDRKEMEGRQAKLTQLTGIQLALMERLRRPYYFDIPNKKFDDLMEFKLWQAQADRLGVSFIDDDLRRMFHGEFFGIIDPYQIMEIFRDARRGANMTDAALIKALSEEYRVRTAQLASVSSNPYAFNFRVQQEGLDLKMTTSELPNQIRAPLTPAQFWDYYKGKRGEFEVTLIPVHVRDYLKDVKEPSDVQLGQFFSAHQRKRYDPTSDVWGLEIPGKVKAEFVMADPQAPAYQNTAHAVTGLQVLSPTFVSPLGGALTLAASYGGREAAYQTSLQKTYESSLSQVNYFTAPYSETDYATPIAFYLAMRQPAAAASLVGQLISPAPVGTAVGFVAWAPEKELAAGLTAEAARRSPTYARVAATSVGTPPLTALAAVLTLDTQPGSDRPLMPTLPLTVVRRDVEQVLDRNTAEEWAHNNMQVLREELEKATGKPAAFKRALEKYTKQFQLTHGKTDEFHTRYSIHQAKDLDPLKQQYLKYYEQINWFEGREGTDRLLRADDFDKLFFGSEPFTATTKFKALAWPPEIMPKHDHMRAQGPLRPQAMPDPSLMQDVQQFMRGQDPTRPAGKYDLFPKAERPALYWRVDDKPAGYPDSIAQVKDRAVEGWKVDQAREGTAIPKAKTVAEALLKTGGEYDKALPEQAFHVGHELITIRGLAQLHPEFMTGRRDYFPYPLPKDRLDNPRDDLLPSLLQLYNLEKPLEFETKDATVGLRYKDVNDLNKALFAQAKKDKGLGGKFVQVIPNRSRTVYYVAAVSQGPLATEAAKKRAFDDYIQALRNAPLPRFQFSIYDTLMTRAQVEHGKEVYARVIEQLKHDFDFSVSEGEDRKGFDNEGG